MAPASADPRSASCRRPGACRMRGSRGVLGTVDLLIAATVSQLRLRQQQLFGRLRVLGWVLRGFHQALQAIHALCFRRWRTLDRLGRPWRVGRRSRRVWLCFTEWLDVGRLEQQLRALLAVLFADPPGQVQHATHEYVLVGLEPAIELALLTPEADNHEFIRGWPLRRPVVDELDFELE